jgi:hypothetical protein
MGLISCGHILSIVKNYHILKNRPLAGDIEGICFGYSLCTSIFAHLRKLQWWFEILTIVCSWKKDSESLSNKFRLSNGEEYELGHLISMVGDFVLKHELIDVKAGESETFDNPLQRELLQPGSRLKVIMGDVTYSIQDSYTFVLRGAEDFGAFLSNFKEIYPNNEVLCLLYSEEHVWSLICQNGNVYLLDPQCSEVDLKYRIIKSVNRSFANFADNFEKIEDIVIGIDMLSLSDPINPTIKKIGAEFTDRVALNYNASALRQISKFFPSHILTMLNDLESASYDSQVKLVRLLSKSGSFSWPNTLQIIIAYAPDSVPNLIKIIKKNPDFFPFIAEALDSYYFNTLHVIIKFAPQHLSEFLILLSGAKILHEPCVKMLLKKQDGTDFLGLLAVRSPMFLSTFFSFMSATESFYITYELMLQELIHNKLYPLHYIAFHYPEHLYVFLESVQGSKNRVEIFSQLLKVVDNKGWTLFHRIIDKCVNCINLLVWLAKNYRSIMLAIHDLWPIEITENKVTATALMSKQDIQTQNLWKGLFSLTVYVKEYSLFGESEDLPYKSVRDSEFCCEGAFYIIDNNTNGVCPGPSPIT